MSTALLATVFTIASAQQLEFASYRRDPDFFTFSSSWDGSAYRQIAERGYPDELPLDGDGNVVPNVWAFLPLYPLALRGLTAGGVEYTVAAALVAAIFGGLAAVALYFVVSRRSGSGLWAVALFSFGPLAFLLQVGYAESMFLALMFGALALIVRQRYLLAGVLGVLACFTHPGALALALALAVLFVARMRSPEPFPLRQKVGILVSGLAIAVAGSAWPFVASAVTGRGDAYLQSELAYWVELVGRQHFLPFTPWYLMATRYMGWFGVIVLVLIAAVAIAYLARRPKRFLPVEARLFAGSYVLYVFAVFLPQQSIGRILLPLAPLLGDPALRPPCALHRGIVIVGCIVLQAVAIVVLWFVSFP